MLGECSALWGKCEGGTCALVFHSTTFYHLDASHITAVSFPGLLPPTVACKLQRQKMPGEEARYHAGVDGAIQLECVVILGALYTLCVSTVGW